MILLDCKYSNCSHRNFKKVKVITVEDLLTNKIEKYEVNKCIRCGYEIKLKEGTKLR